MKRMFLCIILIVFIIFSIFPSSYAMIINEDNTIVIEDNEPSDVDKNVENEAESSKIEEGNPQDGHSDLEVEEEKNGTSILPEINEDEEEIKPQESVVGTVQENNSKSNFTGLVLEAGEYVYYENGAVNLNFTGLCEYDGATWYVISGKVKFNYTGTYEQGDNAYIIENNRVVEIVTKGTTRLMEINGIWRMVVDGKIIYNYTGLGQNGNGIYYIENGDISYKYNGIYNDGTDTYVIEASKVVKGNRLVEISGTWQMVIDGKIVYDYTGVGQNGNGMWYLENGEISYRYNGTWYDGENAYIIEGNRVQIIIPKNTTRLMEINGVWRMVVNDKIIYNYTGLGQNGNGTYYIENGDITYKYNGFYKDGNDNYAIVGSKVVTGTRLVEINNNWYAVIDGKVEYNYTGVIQNGNGKWYLENGNISYKYNGTCRQGDIVYIIENNRVIVNVPASGTRLVEIKGVWRVVVNGTIDYNHTGVVPNGNGMWYIENGEISYRYNGICRQGDIVYIIENNRVVANVPANETRLVEIKGVWRVVVNGTIDYNHTGVVPNGNGMWYIENGQITYTYNGAYVQDGKTYIIQGNRVVSSLSSDTTRLMEIDGIWRMVVNGEIIYDYTGLGQNGNGTYYIEKGNISYKYNGIYSDGQNSYAIQNSKVITGKKLVELDDKWYVAIDGIIDFDYTGVAQNGNGKWYLENGEITYTYNGTCWEDEIGYIIEGNRVYAEVTKNTTALMEINKEWRMVKNGVVDYTYTGVAENGNGKWYLENGKITYTYNAEYTDVDGIVYNIIDSKLKEIVSVPGYPATIVIEQPSKNGSYISDSLNLRGWVLSKQSNDRILVYVDGAYRGDAIREKRDDIFTPDNQYTEYGGKDANPLPGFYYDLSGLRICTGGHTIKIVHMASDGTIMQSREVTINISSMTKSFGIDVSHYQGKIDWEAVKNSGVTFAILKIGEYWCHSGTLKNDPTFEYNYNECKRLGIAVGGYYFSYAFNAEEAKGEAEKCLERIAGKKFELPIFYDVEATQTVNAFNNGVTNKYHLTQACITFCDELLENGYAAGVYSYRNFFQNYLNMSELEKYNIWLADYITQTPYTGKYNYWQYTSSGSVPGINGNVDLNWFYQR